MKFPFFREVGGAFLFLLRILNTTARSSGNYSAIVEQFAFMTWRSLSTVLFSGLFVGAILVIQFCLMLARYDAQYLLGGLNTAAILREIGPLIISFLLAGKVGAYVAAELGTMRVTEQIDAVECLGTDPMQYLVLPRFYGIVLASLVLLLCGLLVSVAGSVFFAFIFYGINPMEYASSIPRFVDFGTVAAGFFRSFVYGILVALVSCYKGFTTTGGAQGVGRAVTETAVYTNLYITMANYFTGVFLMMLEDWWTWWMQGGNG